MGGGGGGVRFKIILMTPTRPRRVAGVREGKKA